MFEMNRVCGIRSANPTANRSLGLRKLANQRVSRQRRNLVCKSAKLPFVSSASLYCHLQL
jgi:hypothetical protein